MRGLAPLPLMPADSQGAGSGEPLPQLQPPRLPASEVTLGEFLTLPGLRRCL